ncbi:AAA family ATPase [Undibacterium sp. Jales W-56]|uniref:AAA family ATPase n=1 Tax=Undibacterium sp. Jales W-56 TaxID=2897325 RepID=UPI0021D2B227|nr:AAA family ATPase [Undibacterium sp. Jales W-56]MCU6434681.1 AAA family ATPase [Undibacterium sp. Jales W-56]
MLTRLRVKGFKSLEDVEVRFGPFTCIAGANGVGKSNLFDAILFLKGLSNTSIIEAANSIRNSGKQRTSIASLFTQTFSSQAQLMEFEADMLVGDKVIDDFSREAKPKVTYLRYKIGLRYIKSTATTPEGIELVHESLDFIQKGSAKSELGFSLTKEFFDSAYVGSSKIDFIYTEENSNVVKIRQDQTSGNAISIPISKADRTILSNINTIDRPTALAARREMQSWTLLQLESSSLRKPDDFLSKNHVSEYGEHLPATLDRLGKNQEIANQLANLLPDVKNVFVDVDEKRQLKTLYLESMNQIKHEARALSDGTLRFLALSIIGADPESGGVICLEEPENGIHPARIPAIVELLYQMAVDTEFAINNDNPLRQIIINTHSPLVVKHIASEDIIVSQAYKREGASLSAFRPVENTWRSESAGADTAAFGVLLDYLQVGAVDDESHQGRIGLIQQYKHQLDLLSK